MPLSIVYKDLPTDNDGCGNSAYNAAAFLRDGIQSIDPKPDGALSAEEIAGIGLSGEKYLRKLNIFKKNYQQITKQKKCVTSGPQFTKLIRQGEFLLKDLGFKCQNGFWSCSRPSVVKTSRSTPQPESNPSPATPADSKAPFKTKSDLEDALYDQELFGKEKYSIFDAKRNDPEGYFPINVALIEIRRFLLREADGNALLAESLIKKWLGVRRLLLDREISVHVRKKLRDVLTRIPHSDDEVYNRGVKQILDAILNRRNVPRIIPAAASVPTIIRSRKTPLPSEFEYPFGHATFKQKRTDTLQKFNKTYTKLIAESLSTAFPVHHLKAKMQISIEPRNGNIKKIVFIEVEVNGNEIDESLIKSVLGGVAEKIRRNYRFQEGVDGISQKIAFSRVIGNDPARR